MFRSFVFATAAIATVWGGSAIAADAVNEIPSAPTAVETTAFSWAGGYAGVHGGYGWMENTLSQGGAVLEDDFNGRRFGGFGGWNFDVGHNVILGIEGDINYDRNENNYVGVKVGSDISGSVRGRAGYAVDQALFFVSGGFTATKAYIESPVAEEKATLKGWTVGAGVDFALTKNIFTRLEYRYNDFGDEKLLGIKVDSTQSVVNIGLGIKF